MKDTQHTATITVKHLGMNKGKSESTIQFSKCFFNKYIKHSGTFRFGFTEGTAFKELMIYKHDAFSDFEFQIRRSKHTTKFEIGWYAPLLMAQCEGSCKIKRHPEEATNFIIEKKVQLIQDFENDYVMTFIIK